MAYIRKKRINNKDYYYLVKSKKTSNRILQKHIAYLGKTFEEALKKKEIIEKDFRGINSKSVDGMGNLTMGIREHIIFPETGDEEIRDIFGLSVTINTTAKNAELAKAFLAFIGMPFKKEETK